MARVKQCLWHIKTHEAVPSCYPSYSRAKRRILTLEKMTPETYNLKRRTNPTEATVGYAYSTYKKTSRLGLEVFICIILRNLMDLYVSRLLLSRNEDVCQ